MEWIDNQFCKLRSRSTQLNMGFSLIIGNHIGEAVQLVLDKKLPLNAASKLKNILKTTLYRYIKKKEKDENATMKPNYNVRQISTAQHEAALVEYILNSR